MTDEGTSDRLTDLLAQKFNKKSMPGLPLLQERDEGEVQHEEPKVKVCDATLLSKGELPDPPQKKMIRQA